VDPDAETDRLVPWLRRLKLHPFRTELKAADFSGGNQQKLLIARNLALPHLRALVVLEPTRGVDIAARETIHDAIVEAAHRGVAVVLASSDLDEVMALSHRILVVRHGRIEGELPSGTDRASLMYALAGKAAA
jgi:ABC-type sugar transport system ATPase subunit